MIVEPIAKGGFRNIEIKGCLGYGFMPGNDEFYCFLLE